MTKVTLIKTRSGFANVPASYRLAPADAAIDEYTEELVTYSLPDGYHVRESNAGSLEIYNASGGHCEIVPHSSGRPQLADGSRNMPVLGA